MRLIVIALVAVGCWTLSAALAWLWAYAALRRDDDVPTYREPEDGIQGADPYSVTLASLHWAEWRQSDDRPN